MKKILKHAAIVMMTAVTALAFMPAMGETTVHAANPVEINTYNFPSEKLCEYLKENVDGKVDGNKDGWLSKIELYLVRSIDVSNE